MQSEPLYKDIVSRVVLHHKKEQEWITLRDNLQRQIATAMGNNAAYKICEQSLLKQIEDLKHKINVLKGIEKPDEPKPISQPIQQESILPPPQPVEALPIQLSKSPLERKTPSVLDIQPIQLLPEPSPVKTSNQPPPMPESPPPIVEKKKKSRKGTKKSSSASVGAPAALKYSISIHLDAVRAVAFYNSMPIVISASDDGTIRLTNCEPVGSKGKKLRNPVNFASLRGHSGPVLCLAQYEANNKQYMISGCIDGTICVWDLPKATVGIFDTRGHVCHDRIYEYELHKDAVWAVATNGTNVVSVSADGTSKYWDITENPQPVDLPVKSKPVQARWVEGTKFVVACQNGEILLFNQTNIEKEIVLDAHIETISNVVDNTILVTCGDNMLRVVSLDEGQQIASIMATTKVLESCAITSDGECYITTATDREVRVWSAESNDLLFSEVLHREKYGESALCSTVTTNDAKTSYFATGGADGSLQVFIHNG